MKTRLTVCFLAVLVSFTAKADLVAPTPVRNDQTGLGTPLRDTPRTYEEFIAASQFASITAPVMITGMQLRLTGGAPGVSGNSWPSQNLTFTQYDLQLSQASAAFSASGGDFTLSSSFAANQGLGLTTVRSGPMTVPAGSFAFDPASSPDAPNLFTFTINFTTPYLYTPGQDLVLLFRSSGYGIAEPVTAFDALVSMNFRATGGSATSASATTATTLNTNAVIENFLFINPVPEPGTVALFLAGGVLALVARSRRRA